jgi:hypothetical protein
LLKPAVRVRETSSRIRLTFAAMLPPPLFITLLARMNS